MPAGSELASRVGEDAGREEDGHIGAVFLAETVPLKVWMSRLPTLWCFA